MSGNFFLRFTADGKAHELDLHTSNLETARASASTELIRRRLAWAQLVRDGVVMGTWITPPNPAQGT